MLPRLSLSKPSLTKWCFIDVGISGLCGWWKETTAAICPLAVCSSRRTTLFPGGHGDGIAMVLALGRGVPWKVNTSHYSAKDYSFPLKTAFPTHLQHLWDKHLTIDPTGNGFHSNIGQIMEACSWMPHSQQFGEDIHYQTCRCHVGNFTVFASKRDSLGCTAGQ